MTVTKSRHKCGSELWVQLPDLPKDGGMTDRRDVALAISAVKSITAIRHARSAVGSIWEAGNRQKKVIRIRKARTLLPVINTRNSFSLQESTVK